MNPVDPKRTALLVMDYQTDILARLSDKAAPALERVTGLCAAARAARLPIIYVVVGFRPGYPELSPRNPALSAVAQNGRLVLGSPGTEVAAAVRPADEDVVVVKHRVSAFAGTDLEMVLRARGIEALILCGISTSGVVLSTVRHAADADYKLFVVKDCCADADDEVHRVLTEKLFIRQATVVSANAVIEALPPA
jgi:nicotinamidase-related amidase